MWSLHEIWHDDKSELYRSMRLQLMTDLMFISLWIFSCIKSMSCLVSKMSENIKKYQTDSSEINSIVANSSMNRCDPTEDANWRHQSLKWVSLRYDDLWWCLGGTTGPISWSQTDHRSGAGKPQQWTRDSVPDNTNIINLLLTSWRSHQVKSRQTTRVTIH